MRTERHPIDGALGWAGVVHWSAMRVPMKWPSEARRLPHSWRLVSRAFGFWLSSAAMTGAFLACGILSPSRSILYEGSQGSVLLEQVPERGTTASFRSTSGLQASHPVILEPVILAAALQGLSISDPAKSGALGASSAVTPIFREEDVAFLGPLLSTALTKATPSQYVLFRLHHRSLDNDARERTSGALYVYGRSLHLALTEYRIPFSQADGVPATASSSTGLTGRSVSFAPATALRPDLYRRSVLPISETLPSLVIDYQSLQGRPTITSTPTVAPASPPAGPVLQAGDATPSGTGLAQKSFQELEDTRTLKELIIKKDLELERLREEVQQLKQDKTKTTTPATGKPPGKKPLPPKSGTP